MRVITGSDISKGIIIDSVITIGNFDGVHRGHMEVFRHLVSCGVQRGLRSVVVTFDPHPLKVLSADSSPSMISTFDQKIAMIRSTGVDYLVVIPFTPAFASMNADDFVNNLLCDSLRMRHIIIGHDNVFGKGREGNYKTLEKIGSERGFTLETMEPVSKGGAVFSSSLARRLIATGDMEGASDVLGRYHWISGKVVHGRDIGCTIGFPTTNILAYNELLPPDGAYTVMVSVDGRLVKGVCSIKHNPTFASCKHAIKVFLLDFEKQTYGKKISVCFIKRLLHKNIQCFRSSQRNFPGCLIPQASHYNIHHAAARRESP